VMYLVLKELVHPWSWWSFLQKPSVLGDLLWVVSGPVSHSYWLTYIQKSRYRNGLCWQRQQLFYSVLYSIPKCNLSHSLCITPGNLKPARPDVQLPLSHVSQPPHHLTTSPPHHLIPHHLTLHHPTTSPFTTSPPHHWPPHHFTMHLTTSPPPPHNLIPPHHLTTSPPRHLTTSPPPRHNLIPPHHLTTSLPLHLTTLPPLGFLLCATVCCTSSCRHGCSTDCCLTSRESSS